MEWTRQLSTVAAVGGAMVLGGLIGLNRERADKPAGFRTHMLVAGASAFLVELGAALVDRFDLTLQNAAIEVDPTRIVQAIVIGIGFLGAGTILRRGESGSIEGLTTSASVLLASAIGIGVAVRQYASAVGVTLLAIVVLSVLSRLERRIGERTHHAPR